MRDSAPVSGTWDFEIDVRSLRSNRYQVTIDGPYNVVSGVGDTVGDALLACVYELKECRSDAEEVDDG